MSTQDFNNPAPNQGAQGTFNGPVNIGANAAPFKALYQLPPPLPAFVGRTEISERVQQHLRQNAPAGTAVAVLRGMGGAGKTQLAYQIAHQLREHFPDGQLVIDALGMSETPHSALMLLQVLIQAFEPEYQATAELDQLQGRYRSLLHNKRVLLLIDNVRNGDQLEPLLPPPPGCALLITTRQRFGPSYAQLEDLEALQETEAEELLRKICPRLQPAQATALARLCGRLPLALHLSAGRLANDPTLDVPDYLDRLADLRQKVELLSDPLSSSKDVESVLQLGYDLLSAAEQSALRQLTVFVARFDKEAAQKVIKLDGIPAARPPAQAKARGRAVPPGIDDVLSSLYRHSWIEYDTGSQRYHLHDIVRAFASARLSSREEGRQRRYASYYAGVMLVIDALCLKGGEHILTGLERFDQDRVHIDAGRNWAIEQQDDLLLLSYASVSGYVLRLRYHPRTEQIPMAEAALRAAQRQGQRKVEAKIHGDLGNAYRVCDQLQAAQAHYQAALDLARATHQQQSEGGALSGLGAVSHALGEYHAARDYFKQALHIFRALGDRHNEGVALSGLGDVSHALGEYHAARDYYAQALHLAQALGDRHNEGVALSGLGAVSHALGEYHAARDYYAQALHIFRALGDRRGEGNRLSGLGAVSHALGEYHAARDYFKQALDIFRALGDRRNEGVALSGLGLVSHALGEYQAAQDYYAQALHLAQALGDRSGEGIALGNLGQVYARLGLAEMAVQFSTQALHLMQTIGDRDNEGYAMKVLGEAWMAAGETQRAHAFQQQALQIACDHGYPALEAEVRCCLGEVLRAQGDLEAAQTQLEQAIALAQALGLKPELALSNWQLGLVLAEQGQLSQAVACLQVGVDFYQAIGHAEAAQYAQQLMQVAATLAAQVAAHEQEERSMETLALARQTLDTLAPYLPQLGQAQLNADPNDRTMQLVHRGWQLLNQATRGNPKAESFLEVYQTEPDDQRNRERLAQQLLAYLQQQQQAMDELRTLVAQLQAQQPNTQSTTSQTINNYASNQGAQGVFHGPVNFNRQELSGDRSVGITGDVSNSPISTGDGNQISL